jgi:hypothetical protein
LRFQFPDVPAHCAVRDANWTNGDNRAFDGGRQRPT